MASPTLQTWLTSSANSATVVLDRMCELANYGLGTALKSSPVDFDDVLLNSDGSWTSHRKDASNFGYGRSYWDTTIWLSQQDGKTTLTGKCSRCGSNSCAHIFGLLAHGVRQARADVTALLQDPAEIQKRTLSSDAADFLMRACTTSEVGTPAAGAAGEKLLFYRILPSRRDLRSRLGLHLGTILKNGGISARHQALDWSSVLWIAKSTPEVPRHSYHSFGFDPEDSLRQTLNTCVTDLDRRLIKDLFLQVGLTPANDLTITNCNLLEYVEELCAQKRLILEDEFQKPLQFGPSKTGHLDWSRSSQGGWRLGIQCDSKVEVVTTRPPMYLDQQLGTIGSIAIKLTNRELELVGLGKSLSDRDLGVVRQHPQAKVWLANLPPLPEVQEEYAGMAKLRPSVSLTWYFDSDKQVYNPYSGGQIRKSDKGRAAGRLQFLYAGLLPRDGSPYELVRTDGTRTIVYTRDVDAEHAARVLVCRNTAWADGEDSEFQIVKGSLQGERLQAKLLAYHREVVSEMHRQGWQVHMNEDWPQRKVTLDSLHFSSEALDDGWFGYEVSTQVNGARIDMLQLLRVALNNKGLLASIANARDDENHLVLTPEGYEISVPVTRLKRLLPFFLTITSDEETGRAKLRRIDFGVVEEARNADNDVIDGSTGLLEVARQLSQFDPNLPQRTLDCMTLPARKYQEYGVAWCDARRKLGFGGVIGDEYAVGKTLQTLLTVFNATLEPEATQPCCLIVVTKTLFFEGRWQEEAQKFLPRMQLAEVYGARQIGRLSTLDGVQAVLTTYDTVVDQLDVFEPIHWNVIACDEGHKLNNNTTQVHKAVAALKARQKLVITGSPMQNGAREMWALMNLTVPGLLKDRAWFNQTFPKAKLVDGDMKALEVSTETQLGNAARLHALGKIVSPFFLRRTNEDLGRQLPAIQVIERHVVMEQDQVDVYEAVRLAGKREAIEIVQEKGINRSRVEVLSQINRLRQVCCDPEIVTLDGLRNIKASSAKRVALLEICQELVEDGKKIVITSEWNRLLDNIAKDLLSAGIDAVFMTGDLSGKGRKEAEDAFRHGGASVMLIQLSLAEGIELPEGDAIIICEPWWNRKKEEQAIARLRRDERQKHINVIRLLVAGSVESGVVRVAQSKLDDIEAVQMGHAAATGGLSLDDIEEFFKPLEGRAIAAI